MQMLLRTMSNAESYVANQEWRVATLAACPLHPEGGCSFARHGSYSRALPLGLRVARWYCPEGHRTFSLLPDFLAARLPGLLETIDNCVAVALTAKSMEFAADLVRGPEVTLPGAIRWLRRRVQAVRAGVVAIADLVPGLPVEIGQAGVLGRLRRSLPMTALANIPPPLGFGGPGVIGGAPGYFQHEVGPDRSAGAGYGCAFSPASARCHANRHPRCQRQQSPPWKTCSGSGVPTSASKTPAPPTTSDGSSGFASMSITLDWRSGRN